MSVDSILMAVGSWKLQLTDEVPPEVWDALDYLGHVVVVRGRMDPAQYGDGLLAPGVAAYAGILRERDSGDTFSIGGPGMAAWLGDEDGKGAVYETAVDITDASFPDAVRALLPASGAVTEGTLYAVPDRTYSGHHLFQDPRTAITYVCQTVSTDLHPVSWRVNSDATIDAGPEADVFVTVPKCIIVRTGAGEDLALHAKTGAMETASDLEDYTTRVVLLAEGEGDSIATGAADIDPGLNPYLDLHGNPVRLTRLVSESDTSTGNADSRAQLQLNRFSGTRNALTLTADDYDIQGDYEPGDWVWVYDPDAGLVDTSNEITFRGRRINPIRLQVTETVWPVTTGHTVAYRSRTGEWLDLTDYVAWEAPGGTKVTVGDFSRALTSSSTEPVGSRPSQDTSVPGVPTFVEPFFGTAYLDGKGFTRARVILNWSAPNNTDGSTIRDGDHYEIRYATDTDSVYPATWSAVSQIRWRDMQTWAQPFAAPDGGQWQIMYVNWSDTSVALQDLSPGVGYDVQIRAVDTSGNAGEWSGTTTFVATQDNIPPSVPEAPAVAASRVAFQITHTLGKASGGVFNLESDLDHLEIHAAVDEDFTPVLGTLIGKLKANAGMISGKVPAVGTFPVETTDAMWLKCVAVDIAGNRSGASAGAQSTALLMDDAHISDLTVSKVTAGTMTASWILAGEIKTADTGARFRASADGIELYNTAGVRTLFGEAATGNVTLIGTLATGSASSGRRILIRANTTNPDIRFYADDGDDYSFISAFTASNSRTGIGINGSQYDNGTDRLTNRLVAYPDAAGLQMAVVNSVAQDTNGGFTTNGPAIGEMGYQSGSTKNSFQASPTQAQINGDNTAFGRLLGQQSGTTTQQVRGSSFANGVATSAIAYAAVYPSTPFVQVGYVSGGGVTSYIINSRTTSGASVTRSGTSGTASVDYLITRGP